MSYEQKIRKALNGYIPFNDDLVKCGKQADEQIAELTAKLDVVKSLYVKLDSCEAYGDGDEVYWDHIKSEVKAALEEVLLND